MAAVTQIRIFGKHRIESQGNALVRVAGPFVGQTARVAVVEPHSRFDGRRHRRMVRMETLVVAVDGRRGGASGRIHAALTADALRQTGIILRDALVGEGASLEHDRTRVTGRPRRLRRVADVRVERTGKVDRRVDATVAVLVRSVRNFGLDDLQREAHLHLILIFVSDRRRSRRLIRLDR